MLKDISVMALNILDDTNNRTNHNEHARGVQDVNMFSKDVMEGLGLRRRVVCYTESEN
jgi:hypothetical protein